MRVHRDQDHDEDDFHDFNGGLDEFMTKEPGLELSFPPEDFKRKSFPFWNIDSSATRKRSTSFFIIMSKRILTVKALLVSF